MDNELLGALARAYAVAQRVGTFTQKGLLGLLRWRYCPDCGRPMLRDGTMYTCPGCGLCRDDGDEPTADFSEVIR